MNRSKMTMTLAILTLVLVTATARADALIQARADVPARVFVDGRPVGVTPVDIAVIQRGEHEIRFRAFGSHRDQAFVVRVPGRHQIVTPLFARLDHQRSHCDAPVVSVAPVVFREPVFVAGSSFGHHRRGGFWR